MKINIDNCEAYFLDYHEGILGPHEVAELMLFLEKHPEMKEVFEEFEPVSLSEIENAEVVYEGKDELKKKVFIDNTNYQKYFVAAVENDLNPVEQEQLKLFIHANPQLQHELELYHKTKLTPDLSIVYEGKEELKRGKGKVVALWYYAAAAAVALLIGMFFILNQPVEKPVANNKTKTPSQVTGNNPDGNPVANNSNTQDSPAQVQSTNSPGNTQVASGKENTIAPVKNRKPNKSLNRQDRIQDPVNTPVIVNNENNQQEENKNDLLPVNNDEAIAANNDVINERYDEPESEPVLANNTSAQGEYSLRDVAVRTLKTSLLKEEASVYEAPNKVSGWDVVAAALRGIRKVSGKSTGVEKIHNENGEVIAYNVSVGNIGFTRTVGK